MSEMILMTVVSKIVRISFRSVTLLHADTFRTKLTHKPRERWLHEMLRIHGSIIYKAYIQKQQQLTLDSRKSIEFPGDSLTNTSTHKNTKRPTYKHTLEHTHYRQGEIGYIS